MVVVCKMLPSSNGFGKSIRPCRLPWTSGCVGSGPARKPPPWVEIRKFGEFGGNSGDAIPIWEFGGRNTNLAAAASASYDGLNRQKEFRRGTLRTVNETNDSITANDKGRQKWTLDGVGN
jgi:hypothetical protein